MKYNYRICGLRVCFDIPWPLKITTESSPFLISPEDTCAPDLMVRFCVAEDLSLPGQGGVWNINAYYCACEQELRIWHCPVRGMLPFCCVIWRKDRPGSVECLVARGQEEQIAYTKNLTDLLGLEAFLLHFGGLILHSSLVDWGGRGILFCAPCGTGKSTQAELWETHMGSRTLNGDRAGIRCENGTWRAWGLPFAGTSGIYRNESVPVRAVVLLRQGPENILTPVRPPEAFRRMLPECSARRWDSDFMNRLIGVLSALVTDVPVYQLTCRPDREAVELLRDTIMKET